MKIGQLYNLDSFQDGFLKSGSKKGFQDAAAGIILARSLEAIDPKIFQKQYPDLTFVNSGMEVSNIGGYAETIKSLRRNVQGNFKTAGDADNNKGKITVTGEDSFLKVVGREANSDWNNTQVEQANLEGRNLIQEMLEAHDLVYRRELDLIGYTGEGANGEGLLNHSGFDSNPASNTIENLTAEDQYDAICNLITEQRSAVNNTPAYSANRVVMPTRVLNVISKTILNTAAGSSSVLAALKSNFPDVEFMSTFRADTEANGGNLATTATVAYNPSDQAMVLRLPVPLLVGEIVKPNSFKFSVDSMYRIGGFDLLESTAGQILTGL